MSRPTERQIHEEAARLALAYCGTAAISGIVLAEAINAKYPGMTDCEFRDVRTLCNQIAEGLHLSADHK